MPRSSMSRIAVLICTFAAFAQLATACGDDDEDDGDLTATLQGVDGVSASGTASFEAQGDGVEIEIEVDGLPPGMHANHVRHGSCTSLGEIHVPLTELEADSDGDAAAETEWADNGLDHFAAGHYVAIHELSTDDGVGPVIVCGDVS